VVGALLVVESQLERAAASQKRLSGAMDRHLANLESFSAWAKSFVSQVEAGSAAGGS
jgi:hypothetical protein